MISHSLSVKLWKVQEPRKDLKIGDGEVILIAVTLGGRKETYSVTIPIPLFA